MNRILGISAYYHDSAAALVADGRIVAAAQEERFSRLKHDARFPAAAIRYCLEAGASRLEDLDAVVFYDKPLVKFERLLESYLANAPSGFRSFVRAMPVWLKEKLYLKSLLRKELCSLAGIDRESMPKLLFSEHHLSHAASAFYPSPFESAAILCMDGVGEWATTSAWTGAGADIKPLWEIQFPHSLGLLYSAITYYTGFRVNSGEYKLMGLAPYGEPRYVDVIERELIDIKDDGTFRLNMNYFSYVTGLRMTNRKFDRLFDAPARAPDSTPRQLDMDLARSIQAVTEKIVLRLARTLHDESGMRNLCLAGGVALNCVANGRLHREGPFDEIWIQPAAGDAGGAIGAALTAWHRYFEKPRQPSTPDAMNGAFLGPDFDDAYVVDMLASRELPHEYVGDEALFRRVAAYLADGAVVGWFQGRMEFGPRALGNRSILGDPRRTEMQRTMNLKIKYRESFRPFAPSVLAERVSEAFDLDTASPYMLVVAPVSAAMRRNDDSTPVAMTGLARLGQVDSAIPAVTHVDYSARIQSVHRATNPRYHRLLESFAERTGCPLVINTSFNVRGEPIVCTPDDAYRCFMATEMDYLVIGNFVLDKKKQPAAERERAQAVSFRPD